jgi:hypothetical protein
MEIRELIDYHFNNTSELLEVKFRTLEDAENVYRVDKILFNELDSFGFGELLKNNDSELEDEDEDDFDFFGSYDMYNEDEIISFLNEYYLIYPERFPKYSDD